MQTSIDLECFDGEYTFKLTMDGLAAIEAECNAGIGEIYARTLAGAYDAEGETFFVDVEARYRFAELVKIIRHGLIGGNSGYADGRNFKVDSTLAQRLIKTYVHTDRNNPVAEAWKLAVAILRVCIHGYEPAVEDAQKKSHMEADVNGSTEARSSETDS